MFVTRHTPWILLLLSGLFGCSDPLVAPIPASRPEETTGRGGTMRLASFADIRALDPAIASEVLGAEVMQMIFAGLIDFDDDGKVIPDLATHFETSPDGLVYRFFLHENVLFHDGNELTAEDVKRSIERALHPSTPNPFASFYENIAGMPEYTEKKTTHLSGVVVEGRYVVSVRLREPDATFLPLFALQSLRPVCKSGGDHYADTWLPCGAGPFKLTAGGWDHGRAVTLVRHDGYFRPGIPRLDGVVFTVGMNVVTERFKFEAGELDTIRDLSEADTQRFLRDPRWKSLGAYEPDRTIYGENMNVEMPPFDNVEIRRAVACAIDREHYRLIRASNVHPAGKLVPPGVPGFNPAVAGQKYDYAAALEHMRKAGYPYDPATGKGGWEPHIEYTAYKQGFAEFSAQVLQQDLAKIGLRIDIRIVSFASYLSITHRRGKSAFSPQGWNQDYPDASDFYETLFSSKSINEDDSNNSAFYKNERFDSLVDRAHHELDPPARQKLYDDADAILRNDAPWAFTHSFGWYDIRQGYVRGYRASPTWVHNLNETWIDRAKAAVAQRSGIFGQFARGSIWRERP